MGDVEETACEVTGTSRVECGVGKTLTCSVRRNEVLDRSETFLERCGDREFDDLSARVGNETLHAHHLVELYDGTAGTGRDHVVDRSLLVECFDDMLAQVTGNFRPDVDRRTAAFVFGQKSVFEVLLFLGGRFMTGFEHFLLHIRDDDVRDRPGDAGVGRVTEAEFLDRVEDLRDTFELVVRDEIVHECAHALVRDLFVHVWEVRRKDRVEEEASDGRLEDLTLKLLVFLAVAREHHDLGAQVDRGEVERSDRGVGRRE